jgi:hypothetical protein
MCLGATASPIDRELARADVVPMHRTQRIRPSGASVGHTQASTSSAPLGTPPFVELRPLDAVRVAPGSTRELAAGGDGLEVLAFGAHSPGDGEMVTDWSAP